MSERGGLPGAPQQAPGFPSNFRPIVVQGFAGLNTKQSRAVIKDEELAICDGWIPLAPNMLRTLWGTGPILYTASGNNIVWFGFGNIADQSYCFVLHSDGSMTAIAYPGGGSSTIMPSGTVANPRSVMGFSQWGSQYILFSADQNNGYWVWDGNNLFATGTASPVVDITDGGANYTSPPTVNVIGGTGSGAAFSASLDNETVSQVKVTNPGSGYSLNDVVFLTFSGSGTRTGFGTFTITNGVLTSVTLINGGSGYQNSSGVQEPPTVSITDPTGSGAGIVVNGMSGGIVTSLQITAGGSNYTAPVIAFSGSGGASAIAVPQNGVLTGFTLVDGGVGYETTPTVQILSGSGAGAVASATVGAGGSITNVTITAGGSGYSGTVYGVFVGGNGPAVATLEMMPFGVSGTWIEIYQGHAWIGNGAAVAVFPPKGRVIYSAGGSPVNFGGDGGAFLDTNSFARVGYHSGHQVNGFLYLIGDSSLDYISNVQTPSTPTPSETSFNNQNADPQIGSSWPSSSIVYSRNIWFANTIGIYISAGGSVSKISLPLDGIYATGSIRGSTADFPSAVANIFGNVIGMLLLPIIDQVTGETVNKLLMWDGISAAKPWFTSSQDRNLTYISTLEINSVLQAWGTDGTNIFPLFYEPQTFPKTFQSKLFANPAYWMTKTANELFGVIQNPSAPLTITIDNELGNGTGGGSVSVLASSNEFNVFGPIPCGQNGSLIGLTVSTTAGEATINSLTIVEQDEATRI